MSIGRRMDKKAVVHIHNGILLCWCFSFWLTSLCIIASISLELTQMCSFLYSWIIFYSVYVPQLPYPFICQWTSRLLPCPSCRKQRCSEHRGTCVCFNSGFLGVYAQQWVAKLYGSSVSSFLRNLHTVLVCIPTNSVKGFLFLHTLSSIDCL